MSLRRAAAAVVLVRRGHRRSCPVRHQRGLQQRCDAPGQRLDPLQRERSARVDARLVPGRPDDLHSQAGAPQAYLAANYNNAAAGGTLANWLISPTFSTQDCRLRELLCSRRRGVGLQRPCLRGASARAARASPTSPSGVGHSSAATGLRSRSASPAKAPAATGRFAIVYTGPADLANYVGVDTFAVAVPEPETWALMLAGLAGLGVLKRRRAVRR